MRSCIDLYVIQGLAFIDRLAIDTLVARISILEVQTIYCLGYNSGSSCLSCPSWSEKEKIMMLLFVAFHLSFEDLGNVFLSDNLIEGLWTVFIG